MRTPLPHFDPGMTIQSLSAASLNRVVAAVEDAHKQVARLELMVNSRRGASVGWVRHRTVVITKRPENQDRTLTAREAGYSDVPARPCEGIGIEKECYYRWFGIDFQVYTPLGKDITAYEGDEQVPADDLHPPRFDSVFHRCHREREAWVMDSDIEEVAFVIVRAVWPATSPTPRIVRVQQVHRISQTIDEFEPTGSEYDIYAWPGLVSEDFEVFRWTGATITRRTHILKAYSIGGCWYLEQLFRYQARRRPTNVRITDCRTPMGGT